jgi:hypothetical protein
MRAGPARKEERQPGMRGPAKSPAAAPDADRGDDLLDVSRITRGTIQLRREPVELALIVARAVESDRTL